MELNSRKIKILEAIITDYISTGEPVGSRTIAKKYDLGISSATIRNEMSDLEELGLIEQLHTSSGRVPSKRGYRLYVDEFMTKCKLTDEEVIYLEEIVANNINQVDYLMEETAKALSMLTNYTTVVSKPQVTEDKIKAIQLMPFDDNSILATLVTKNKVIKNFEVPTEKNFTSMELNFIVENINNILLNYTLDEIEVQLNSSDDTIKTSEEKLINNILEKTIDIFLKVEDTKIFTSGINNILEFKEFNTIEKAKSIFNTLEEKDVLINILENNKQTNNISNEIDESSIQILIGDEHHIEGFKECSIIKTEYKIADAKGTMCIIAPTRMDYARAVSILDRILNNIRNLPLE